MLSYIRSFTTALNYPDVTAVSVVLVIMVVEVVKVL